MKPYTQACLPGDYLSKTSLLAFLPSKIDTTRAIVTATGQVIDVSQLPQNQINPHLNDGSWIYYETLLPRRMLLTNPQWQITSFSGATRRVCVQIFAESGMRVLNFTLPQIIATF